MTIVIPVYNGAAFIGNAVVSALAQSYEPLTVLVIDNASTDGTADKLSSFQDRRLIVKRYEEHLPLAANWDRALQAAEGDLVLVMSADNVMMSGAVSVLAERLITHPECGLAVGLVELEVAPGHRRISLSPSHELKPGVIDDLEGHLLSCGYNFSINAVLFRRALPGLLFDASTGHGCDVDLMLRLGKSGVRAVAVNKPIHRWLDHPDTVSTKRYDRVWEAILSAYIVAGRGSGRQPEYRSRIGRMLMWECMLLLRRGDRALAVQRVKEFGPAASVMWRTLVHVMLAVPGGHMVPGAIRWLCNWSARRSREDGTARPVTDARLVDRHRPPAHDL